MTAHDSPHDRQPPATDSRSLSHTRLESEPIQRGVQDETLVGVLRDGNFVSQPQPSTEDERSTSDEAASKSHTDKPSSVCESIVEPVNEVREIPSNWAAAQYPKVPEIMIGVQNHLNHCIREFHCLASELHNLSDMVSENTRYIEDYCKKGNLVHAQIKCDEQTREIQSFFEEQSYEEKTRSGRTMVD